MPSEPSARERLFFALWPGPTVRAALARRAREACAGLRGRPTPADNLHVTLAFLGDLDAERRACMEAVAGRLPFEPFDLVLDRLEYVPRNRILWLGAGELPMPLARLAGGLNAGLRECGHEPERRPFRAHITLMRKLDRPPRHLAPEPLAWHVDGFALVRSRLAPEGAHYEVVARWPAG